MTSPMWMRSEAHAVKEDYTMSNTDTLIAAANALIAEHAGKRTLWEALRHGISLLGDASAGIMSCAPDPALLERMRVVVCNNIATVEAFDGRDWKEVWRSAAPDVNPPKDNTAAEAISEHGPLGPPVPGQIVLTKDGLKVWGNDDGPTTLKLP